jgi:hypothetical protein
MKIIKTAGTISLSILCLGMLQASAGTIDSLVGDKDGFGLPGAPAVPANGTLWQSTLGGSFFGDYRGPGDVGNAAFTDIWDAPAGVTYSHTYGLSGTPLGAILSIQFAGVADQSPIDNNPNRGPWDVKYNGTLIGQIPVNTSANAYQEVETYTFNVPVGLLTGSDAVALGVNIPNINDGFIINFSELHIRTLDNGQVPEVASALGLLSFGLLSLVGLKRKLAA